MRFRVEVQRAWKIQLGGLLWGFRKSEKFKPPTVAGISYDKLVMSSS